MDRAEAIYRLRVMVVEADTKEDIHALDLAIEALQEPSVSEKESVEGDAESATTTEDCISRQAVTDLLLDAQDGSGQTYEVIRDLLHEVAYMPSVPVAETATTTDLISRQQAINAVENTDINITESEWDELINALNNLPPVTPPKRVIAQINVDTEELIERIKEEYEITDRVGEWIPVKKVYRTNDVDFPKTHMDWETATDPDDVDAVRCSRCGEVFDFGDARNWCTECGAKMKVV